MMTSYHVPKLERTIMRKERERMIARMSLEELDYRRRAGLELLKYQKNIFLRQIENINKSFLKRFFLKDEIEYAKGAIETIERQMHEIEPSEAEMKTNRQLENSYHAIMRDIERYSFGVGTRDEYLKVIEVKRLTSLLTKSGETKMKFEIKQAAEVKDEPTTLELVKRTDAGGRITVVARKGTDSQALMSFQDGKFKRWQLCKTTAARLGIVTNSKGLICECEEELV